MKYFSLILLPPFPREHLREDLIALTRWFKPRCTDICIDHNFHQVVEPDFWFPAKFPLCLPRIGYQHINFGWPEIFLVNLYVRIEIEPCIFKGGIDKITD